MKFKFIKDNDEFIEAHAKEKNELVNAIEELVINDSCLSGANINGYLEDDVVPLKLSEIVSFYVENDKTYAELMNKTYQIKMRLYQLEECLTDNFIKINKSRIVNKNFIQKFDLSWSGTILIIMKNNKQDYVSRRQVKHVKERMNIR